MRKQAALLDHVAYSPAQLDCVPLAAGLALNQNLAAGRFEEAIDQLERGCLSGAAAPQQYKRFAARDFEAHVLDKSPHTFDGQRDVAKLNYRFAWGLRSLIRAAAHI